MFRMTKPAVLSLSKVLRPHVSQENTKYRLAIPVLIRVACALFKLAHGANLAVQKNVCNRSKYGIGCAERCCT